MTEVLSFKQGHEEITTVVTVQNESHTSFYTYFKAASLKIYIQMLLYSRLV